jgi:YidC/Oxa1 family membrane protein insertase
VRRIKWLILLAVLAAAFLLSGCGVSQAGVDVVNTPPQGLWQTLVVWPLARALIWLDEVMLKANVPYHWGFAIIVFTLIVKVVTFPLTISQIRGMQAQKELQPKIQELQKKYGKDREKLSQEQMKLYQEAGVNPLSGCLPLLIQMPVLFGLYAALVAIGPSLANARFFWIPDLAFPHYTGGMSWISEAFSSGDYFTLVAYLILPILLMVSQFVMQKWMTPATPDADSSNPTAGMTKQLSWMMTFMFGFFTLQVPSGLTLYWVTSNLLQMLQQWVVTSDRFGLAKPAKPAVAGAAPTLPDKQKQTSNGAEPTPTSVNVAAAEAQKAAAKDVRRRRAKRR